MKRDVTPNMHGRGRCRKFGRKCSKEELHLEDICEDRRTQTQHTVD